MQGRGKFNRCRFNLPTLQDDIALRDMQLANLEAAPDIGGDIPFDGDAAENVRSKSGIGFGVAASARCAVTLSQGIYLTRIYSLSGELSITLSAETDGTLNCKAGGEWDEALNARPKVKGDNLIADECFVRVHASGTAGANYNNQAMEGYEIMNGSTSTAQYDTEYIEISVPIPAGGKLVIDSENYTVTLNGENVLHAQSGAWLMLDRDVQSVKIIFPSRVRADAYLEYKERFL